MRHSGILLALCVLLAWSISSHAALTPGARYFSGQVRVGLAQSTVCRVEIVFSPDLGSVTTRSISTLQHLSNTGELIWVGLGPYKANFLAARALYRYQDPTPGAIVKDLVLNTAGPAAPTKYSVLYWHNDFSHHDPMVCDRLVEATSPADLQAMDEAFANFDSLKP
jgi:hypothetical protein